MRHNSKVRILRPPDIMPVTHLANYHDYGAEVTWGPRTISDLQFIFIVAGSLQFHYADAAPITVQRGEVLLIEPAREHTLSPATPSGGTISTIHCELTTEGNWALEDYRLEPHPEQVTRNLDYVELDELFQRCAKTYASYSLYQQERVTAITKVILLLLAEQWNTPATLGSSLRMRRMLAYIREHLTKPLTRQDLATAFHLSPEHVNFLFRTELNLAPGKVIARERCLLALKLFNEEGLSVKEVAPRVGYEDPFYFSRVFKQVIGAAPSHFR